MRRILGPAGQTVNAAKIVSHVINRRANDKLGGKSSAKPVATPEAFPLQDCLCDRLKLCQNETLMEQRELTQFQPRGVQNKRRTFSGLTPDAPGGSACRPFSKRYPFADQRKTLRTFPE